MKLKLPRRVRILNMFTNQHIALSCQQVSNRIAKQEKIIDWYKKRYLPGSVSSKLHKAVKDGVLKYAGWTTDRGGHVYQLNKKTRNGQ